MGVSRENLIKALEASGGIMSKAAEMLGVTRAAVRNRIIKDTELVEKLEECKETRIDIAEDALGRLVKADNLGAVCFTLKCLGKERGYVEQVPEKPVQLNLQVNVERLGEALRSELEHRSRAIPDLESDPLD